MTVPVPTLLDDFALPAATPLLPANPSFAGHQTFAFRLGWLKKGLDALTDPAAGGSLAFSRDDALVTLGVGKNMVQSIRHWLLVMRLAEDAGQTRGRELKPTELGTFLFGAKVEEPGRDPFLEDPATLWLLHWQLAGPGSLAFTWAWTFSLLRQYEFGRESLTDALAQAANGRTAKPPSRETLLRDVECLLHTYVTAPARTLATAFDEDDSLLCPLQGLGLIRAGHGGVGTSRTFTFAIGPKPTLPPAVFFWALLAFWQTAKPSTRALALSDVTFGEGSPGLVFKLDEDTGLPA